MFARIKYLIGIAFFIVFFTLFSLYKPITANALTFCSLGNWWYYCSASTIDKTCNEGSAGTCGGYCSGNSNDCCTNGNSFAGPWTNTTYECLQEGPLTCYGNWIVTGNTCSTGDTCNSGYHGLVPGYCDCSSGPSIYKVCCNGSVSEACYGGSHSGSCPHGSIHIGPPYPTTIAQADAICAGGPPPPSGTPCDTCSGGYGACTPSCGAGTQTCTLDTYTGVGTTDPCTVLHNGSYYYGGACNDERTILYQCGGSPNHGSGSSVSHQVCNCQVNNGTYDTCASALTCTPGTSAPRACPGPSCDQVPIGWHDGANCSVINGWTCDPDNYNLPLNVHFYEGPGFTNFVGATIANVTREPAVGAQCGGNSAHGFNFTPPSSLIDGNQHTIYAYPINIDASGNFTGINPALNGTPKTLGPCNYNVTVNAYVDYNGNGFQDPTDPPFNGNISYTGGVNGSRSLGAGGTYTISNISPGDETVTLTNIPAGWKVTTANNPDTVNGPPDTTVNFGVQPPPPDCGTGIQGNLTANSPIYLGGTSKGTSNLKANCTLQSGATGTIDYSWSAVEDPTDPTPPYNLGSVVDNGIADVNAATTTYTSPAIGTTKYPFNVDIAVTACNPGTSAPADCTSKMAVVTVNPLFTVSGSVYVDANKNKFKDAGESNYDTPTFSISPNPDPAAETTISAPGDGTYTVNNLPALPTGSFYTLSYTNPPPINSEYTVIYPVGTPPSFAINVGTNCNGTSFNGTTCPNGNILGLNFAVTNSHPWIQTIGGDIYENGGIANALMPSSALAACGGANTSVPSSAVNFVPADNTIGSPGIVYTGTNTTIFGGGQPNPNNWLVGGVTYPEPIQLSPPNTVLSSYAHISQLVKDAGATPTPLCANPANCSLPGGMNSGVYAVDLGNNGILNLTVTNGANPTFSKGDYVILVSGGAGAKVNLAGEIHVPTGNTLLLTSQTDIHVLSTIGTNTPTDYTAIIEGYYSSDKNFIVDGTGNQCPTTGDLKLNIQGAIVANAALNGGSFQVNRDLCANDNCPVVTVKSRPDFVLNAPKFYLTIPRVEKEVAP